MHEPLVIGLVLPTFKHRPWFCAHTPLMDHCKSAIRESFVLQQDVTVLLKRILRLSADLRRMTAEETTKVLSQSESFIY